MARTKTWEILVGCVPRQTLSQHDRHREKVNEAHSPKFGHFGNQLWQTHSEKREKLNFN